MWSVYDQYKIMFSEVKKVVKIFVTTESLNWAQTREELRKKTQQQSKTLGWTTRTSGDLANDPFTVALSAFLTGIHTYLSRHITKSSMTWTDESAKDAHDTTISD
jgi:hypothetical protein